MLDVPSEQRGRVEERLRGDQIAWIGMVRADGQPHLVPVWFLWEGETALIFSKPDQKVRNLRQNPRATLHFNSTPDGGDVVILEGEAELLPEPTAEVVTPAYVEKYAGGMESLGMSRDAMAAEFRQPIRFRPAKVLSW